MFLLKLKLKKASFSSYKNKFQANYFSYLVQLPYCEFEMLMRVFFFLLLFFLPLLSFSFPSPYSSLLIIKGEPQEDKTNNVLYFFSKTRIYFGWGYGYGIVFYLEHSFSLSNLCFLINQSADHNNHIFWKSKSSFDSHLFEFHKSNERGK